MDKLQLAWHYLVVISPWLVVSLLPSLITGLSPYPKAAGVVSALRKLLSLLSILTHSDSPGTLKPLLVPAKMPAKVGE